MQTNFSKEQWYRLLEEQEKCGISQKLFCQNKNISLSQFTYYRGLYVKEKISTPGPKFESVKLVNPSLPPAKEAVTTKFSNPNATMLAEIKLLLPNGFQCTMPSHYDMARLKQLIEVLLTC
ncbi:MAG: hypothetical protein QM752_00230 [Gammaproteobacteria bacterium]